VDRSVEYYPQINTADKERDLGSWAKANEFYEAGQWRKAIESTIKFVEPGFKGLPAGDASLVFPHGSIRLELKIEGERISLRAPFLNLPASGAKIALMRQVAELNFANLSLSWVRLDGDTLTFHYEDALSGCEPTKLYFILEEICYCADDHDDFYIEKFGATRVVEPELNRFDRKRKDEARAAYKAILESSLARGQDYADKRDFSNACTAYNLALNQISYVIAPQGALGDLLRETYSEMYSDSDDVETTMMKARKGLEKLLAYENAKFDEAMFYPSYFVPYKKYASVKWVQDEIEEAAERIDGMVANRSYEDAAISALYNVYNLFWSSTLPEKVRDMAAKALKKASGKPWKDAANVLNDLLQDILAMKAPKE
jgi:hypothetical protein